LNPKIDETVLVNVISDLRMNQGDLSAAISSRSVKRLSEKIHKKFSVQSG
jgi:hypothetical protein